jgi:DNA repair protein RadC
MSTVVLAYQYVEPAQDIMEQLREISAYSGQDYHGATTLKRSEAFSQLIINLVGQMDDNVCLVEYLNFNQELLTIRSFVDRGRQQGLAESIIGNGLVTSSQGIVILRNRKSGDVTPKLHDRQLIRYLLSGLKILGTSLLDYIINREGQIFSAQEAGILKNGVKPEN